MDWISAAYAVVIAALAACAIYALVSSWYATRRKSGGDDADDFITARGSVGVWMLAFSFYAGAMGSWVVTAPANYASFAGLLGLSAYAFASGVPIVVVGYAGGVARAADPGASSLPDFLYRRFRTTPSEEGGETEARCAGAFISAFASAIILFNMSIAMLAEYATLGTLFRDFVGAHGFSVYVPTLLMALFTLSYTVVGGLYVSILTDRLQAIAAVALVLILSIYLSGFQAPPDGFHELTTEQAGFTYAGFSSLFTMPASLIASTMFSEAVWQRVWASEDNATLRRAAWLGGSVVSIVVFFFGFIGFLALWSGRANATTNENLYFFACFSTSPAARLDSIPGLLALLCASFMSEGAVDSLQNGIAATLSSTLLKGKPLWATRAVVLAVNLPLAVLGATPLISSVLQLFLLANLITVVSAVPLFAALYPGQWARRRITEGAVLFGCFSGALGLSCYGIMQEVSIGSGLYTAWIGNNYGYDYFLIALAFSVAGLFIGVVASCFSKASTDTSSSEAFSDSDASS